MDGDITSANTPRKSMRYWVINMQRTTKKQRDRVRELTELYKDLIKKKDAQYEAMKKETNK